MSQTRSGVVKLNLHLDESPASHPYGLTHMSGSNTPHRVRVPAMLAILDGNRGKALFAPWLRDPSTWRAWFAFLAALVAAFRDYSVVLPPGERGTVMCLATDRRQARTVLRYIAGFFDACRCSTERSRAGPPSRCTSRTGSASRSTPRASAPCVATRSWLRSATRSPFGMPDSSGGLNDYLLKYGLALDRDRPLGDEGEGELPHGGLVLAVKPARVPGPGSGLASRGQLPTCSTEPRRPAYRWEAGRRVSVVAGGRYARYEPLRAILPWAA